jgi:ribosome-associated protein
MDSEGKKTTEVKMARRPRIAGSRERAIRSARVAAENRGRDVLVLDMTALVDWVDYLVIATASSRRQIAAIADDIEEAMAAMGDRKVGIEGYDRGGWTVVDFVDVIVHLFDDVRREYYQLEHLWADAPRIAWEAEVPMGKVAAQ